ncbi:GntR family transcriptional regulator [Sulfobacillus thermosulfidooxidans]|uniref:GntR family transcriptional regulator n=1 Tax=Sulfobacillus thermosulfidooxidans TaxID=28034 RepID=UPI00040A7B7E|nr:GntR family transcriptional regulator [Sulfobacillus thermosulfidooxidans]
MSCAEDKIPNQGLPSSMRSKKSTAPDTLGENSAKALPARLPLPRQVASAIRSRIISREWEPGDQIPSEDELAKLFAVSRATVREAVSLLSVQGYLVKKRGIGTFVAQAQAISGGLESLISITEWIERHGYQAGTSYIDMKTRVPTSNERTLFQAWDLEEVMEIHRVRTANGVPVLYCVDVMPKVFAPENSGQLDESLFQYLERKWGQVVIFAQTEIDVSQATRAMAHHLQVAQDTPLLRLRQAHFNQKSLPILWSQDHFVTDRFRFEVMRHRQ